MSDIQYSRDARNVANRFYRVDSIVYVEGDDDVLFWETILRKFSDISFKVLAAGNSEEVEKRIAEIVDGQLNAIAARDSDYLPYLGATRRHPRVLYTFGHSIENTLFVPEVIHAIWRVCARGADSSVAACRVWFEQFLLDFRKLVVLDLANEIEGAGLRVLGDNCSKFMKNQKSENPDLATIENCVASLSQRLTKEAIEAADALVSIDQTAIGRTMRGHFMMSGVQKFISRKLEVVGRKSCSYENLYTNAIVLLDLELSANHPHADFYQDGVRAMARSFQ